MKDRILTDLINQNQNLIKKQYEGKVVSLIRKEYSQDDETAIIRKKLADLDDGEFEKYNTFVEECKKIARG